MSASPALLALLPEPVLVVGGYGYRNVGDEAILAGLLQELGGRRVTVVSRTPAETSATHQVRAVAITRALAELRRHRTLLIGGGGLFGRDMGMIGRLLPAYGLLAAASGRRVVLAGIGIDEPLAATARPLVRLLVHSASRVVVRDTASASVVAGWGCDASVAPDLSWRMPAAPPAIGEALLRQSGLDGARPAVGLALTGVNRHLAPAVISAVAAAVQELPEVDFCLIPMSQHPFVPRHNDLLFAQSVQAAAPRAQILQGSHHPAAILSVFGSLAAAVCMRYHGLLFAERAGVPIIPISYATKCEAWLSERDMTGLSPSGNALTEAIVRLVPASRMVS